MKPTPAFKVVKRRGSPSALFLPLDCFQMLILGGLSGELAAAFRELGLLGALKNGDGKGRAHLRVLTESSPEKLSTLQHTTHSAGPVSPQR